MALNFKKMAPEQIKRVMDEAHAHLRFMISIYWIQIRAGRHFLHEHPHTATSWSEACIDDILRLPSVGTVVMDQCQFGAEVQSGVHQGQPVKKPTRWMSNAPALLKALDRRCTGHGGDCSRPGGGTHQWCEGKIAREAAIYPDPLCLAIIKGMRSQLEADGIMSSNFLNVMRT